MSKTIKQLEQLEYLENMINVVKQIRVLMKKIPPEMFELCFRDNDVKTKKLSKKRTRKEREPLPISFLLNGKQYGIADMSWKNLIKTVLSELIQFEPFKENLSRQNHRFYLGLYSPELETKFISEQKAPVRIDEYLFRTLLSSDAAVKWLKEEAKLVGIELDFVFSSATEGNKKTEGNKIVSERYLRGPLLFAISEMNNQPSSAVESVLKEYYCFDDEDFMPISSKNNSSNPMIRLRKKMHSEYAVCKKEGLVIPSSRHSSIYGLTVKGEKYVNNIECPVTNDDYQKMIIKICHKERKILEIQSEIKKELVKLKAWNELTLGANGDRSYVTRMVANVSHLIQTGALVKDTQDGVVYYIISN